MPRPTRYLIPQLTGQPPAKDKVLHSTAFFTGGAILLAVAVVAG